MQFVENHTKESLCGVARIQDVSCMITLQVRFVEFVDKNDMVVHVKED